MKLVLRWTYLAVLATTVACGKTPASSAPAESVVRTQVDSAAERLLYALRNDNADSLAALLEEDVVMMPPNEPVLRGKAAVDAWYRNLVSMMRTSNLTITQREVFIGGDWATEVAGFEWTLAPAGGGPSVTDRGSYMQLWHRAPDGRWMFSREIWNSIPPAP